MNRNFFCFNRSLRGGNFGNVSQLTVDELLTVNGPTDINGALTVIGNSTFTGDIGLTGNSTFTGTFGVTGNSTFTGDATVTTSFQTENFKVDGDFVYETDAQAIDDDGTILINNPFILITPANASTTGVILTPGIVNGQQIFLQNVSASNSLVFAATATSNVEIDYGTFTDRDTLPPNMGQYLMWNTITNNWHYSSVLPT